MISTVWSPLILALSWCGQGYHALLLNPTTVHRQQQYRSIPTRLLTTTTTTADTESASSTASLANFDYLSHWYPVIWASDVPLNDPVKVTVFDVDYVVAKTSDSQVMAMEDVCPHKGAALSQGRVTTTGHFQCAYHGWSFNGTNGACVEIPQLVQYSTNLSSKSPPLPRKSCGTSVPAQIHQGMIWLFPGGGWEDALVAPPPPTVPEVEEKNWKMSTAIRDMPVDWPIVVSNICDPDHGMFAHQAKAFDMYTASKDYPLQITEGYPNDGKGYVIQAQVDASEKLLEVDRHVREEEGDEKAKKKKSKKKKKEAEETPWATSYLQMPSHLQLKRVTKDTYDCKFVSAFYICPVGTGRTRFMSAGVSKSAPPNWLTKLFLDNFVDQDTYLLATQQTNILSQEAQDIRAMMEQEELKGRTGRFQQRRRAIRHDDGDDDDGADRKKNEHHDSLVEKVLSRKTMPTRRRLFCLSSPSERMGAKIERFWDATLLRAPNRITTLLQLDEAGAFRSTPSREFVLDRKTQHLDLRKDSQDVVRNCERVMSVSNIVTVLTVAAKVISTAIQSSSSPAAAATVATTTAATTTATAMVAAATKWLQKLGCVIMKPSSVILIVLLCQGASTLAKKLKREYFFKYTDDYRRKDLGKIPKLIWTDK